MKVDERIDDEMMDEPEHKSECRKSDERKEHKEHKMMTMEDVAACLEEDFSEEIADSKKYLCMAKIANCAGDEYDNRYLLEMAKDEYTHALFIHDFMERHNIHIPEEKKECFDKLEEEMSRFF